ncbi:MAG: hypothetical protein Q8R28_05710, partial [Dehalococcoidia bacterium]|nr:hypothetical protein [Dehalococcoidia bacterium]
MPPKADICYSTAMSQTLVPYSEMAYSRPLPDAYATAIASIQTRIDAGDLAGAVTAWQALRTEYATASCLNSVAYNINTTDTAAREEKTFLDAHRPDIAEWDIAISRALLEHPDSATLDPIYGPRFRRLLELSLETFDPRLKDDLRREQALKTQYTDLLASARIDFQGETLTLSTLGRYQVAADRQVREAAFRARFAWLASQAPELDR